MVDGLIDREDVNAILKGIFDINVKLSRIDGNLEQITTWLGNEGNDGEEEEDPPGPTA